MCCRSERCVWWVEATPFRAEVLSSGPRRELGASLRSPRYIVTVRTAPSSAGRTTATTGPWRQSGAGPCLRQRQTGQAEATPDSFHACAAQRVGTLLLQDPLSGHLHERGNRHEDWSHRVQGPGKLQLTLRLWFFCFQMFKWELTAELNSSANAWDCYVKRKRER
jgi:hypothetical protein